MDGEEVKFAHTLQVEWSDTEADYVYVYRKLQEYSNGERRVISQTTGNKEWAQRIASHYSIDVPVPEEDNK